MLAVITGASRGIGYAIAEAFAAKGYNLLITSLNNSRLEKAMQALKKNFPAVKILAKPANLGNKKETLEFASWCLEKSPAIDILVNNSGSFAGASVHNEQDGALETMIETNLYSAYHLSRALLPSMMKRKSGHIFNITSIAGIKAYPGGGAYSISKFALQGFSVNLREEMKPYNIKVTSVIPGAAYTDSWKASGLPESRFMQAEDIARMVVAASELSVGACVEDIILRPQGGDI